MKRNWIISIGAALLVSLLLTYAFSDAKTQETVKASAVSYLEAEGFTNVSVEQLSDTEDCMPYHEIRFLFSGTFPAPTLENIKGFACAEEINGEWVWANAILAHIPSS